MVLGSAGMLVYLEQLLETLGYGVESCWICWLDGVMLDNTQLNVSALDMLACWLKLDVDWELVTCG